MILFLLYVVTKLWNASLRKTSQQGAFYDVPFTFNVIIGQTIKG